MFLVNLRGQRPRNHPLLGVWFVLWLGQRGRAPRRRGNGGQWRPAARGPGGRREVPCVWTGPRSAAPTPTAPPAASGPHWPIQRGTQRLGFSALFSVRPSTLIKARQAGYRQVSFSRWDRVPHLTPPHACIGGTHQGLGRWGTRSAKRSLEGAARGLLIHFLDFPKLGLLRTVMINQTPHLGTQGRLHPLPTRG